MDEYLYHHGIKGQKWYVRRYQNEDGSLTPAGEKRYNDGGSTKTGADVLKSINNTKNGYNSDDKMTVAAWKAERKGRQAAAYDKLYNSRAEIAANAKKEAATNARKMEIDAKKAENAKKSGMSADAIKKDAANIRSAIIKDWYGKYGSGKERDEALRKLGYDPDAITKMKKEWEASNPNDPEHRKVFTEEELVKGMTGSGGTDETEEDEDMIDEKLAVKKKLKADEAKKASETVVKSVVNDSPFISFVKSTQSKIETGTEYVKSLLNKEK